MKIEHICSIIIMISTMFISGCVGYAQQPYPHYSAPIFAHPNAAPYGGGYNYAGGYGGYAVAPHPYTQPGREFRDYGTYRSHDNNERNHHEAGRAGGHEER
jgi:hypothetical protein